MIIALAAAAFALTAPPAGPVKVFVLSGQSNMQGHGFVAADPKRNEGKGSLEAMAKNPASPKMFKQLLNKDGSWKVRNDVWIDYFERKGLLTVGYGAGKDTIGPELGFGNVVGDSVKDPVLLIKICWGGKSLAQEFRPPSSGGTVGPNYLELVKLTKEALASVETNFPALKGRQIQLTGFGWHQGWNDRINGAFVQEYEKNMAKFIRDIRKDLATPNLFFVIAETGMGGMEEKNQRALDLMKAQAAVAEYPEFKTNVAFVGTRAFWRPTEISPSNQGYHWNSNAETYYRIGDSMGHAMIDLMGGKRK